jgi:hypothetical protein
MNNDKPTSASPRPWRTRGDLILAADGRIAADAYRTTLSSADKKAQAKRNEANAALIVRSVNSLEVAEKVYDALKLWIDKARFFSPDAIEYNMSWEQATAAITEYEKAKEMK